MHLTYLYTLMVIQTMFYSTDMFYFLLHTTHILDHNYSLQHFLQMSP